MAKKNFSGGLDSLLGGAPIKKDTSEDKPKKTVTPSQSTSTTPTSSSTSQKSIIDQLSITHREKIEAIAEKEGRSTDEIIKEAIGFYLEFQVDL